AGRARARRELLRVIAVALEHLEDRSLRGPRKGVERPHRAVAQPAAGDVEDAKEGEIVLLVRDDFPVRDDVPDLLAIEPALPADERVGNVSQAELLLEGPRLDRGS